MEFIALAAIGCSSPRFFSLGMSIEAMAVISLVILAEKMVPWPTSASYTAGVVLVLYGAVLVASPLSNNVRYWHIADIRSALHMSAIGGKADMPFCTAYVR